MFHCLVRVSSRHQKFGWSHSLCPRYRQEHKFCSPPCERPSCLGNFGRNIRQFESRDHQRWRAHKCYSNTLRRTSDQIESVDFPRRRISAHRLRQINCSCCKPSSNGHQNQTYGHQTRSSCRGPDTKMIHLQKSMISVQHSCTYHAC